MGTVITIDGPAGSGKSTIARKLAKTLGARFLDTGAMYRAVTLAAVRDRIELEDEAALASVIDEHKFDFKEDGVIMRVSIDGEDVTERIREPELTAKVKYAAGAPAVREKLVDMQREYAERLETVVTEGRDQGTAVFPDADFKFYLNADVNERAERRRLQLEQEGKNIDFERLCEDILQRDESDMNRSIGPLIKAEDAVEVDTTNMSIEETAEILMKEIRQV